MTRLSIEERSENTILCYLYTHGGTESIKPLLESNLISAPRLSQAFHSLLSQGKIELISFRTMEVRMVQDV